MSTDDIEHAQILLRERIAALRSELREAQRELNTFSPDTQVDGHATPEDLSPPSSEPHLHTLLLLADSALPLGSFAFSSGLESCLAHNKIAKPGKSTRAIFDEFLLLSLRSLASTALPYVLAAWREPHKLQQFNNDFDASTPCGVARRASIAQGKAFLTVWDRSFKVHFEGPGVRAVTELREFSYALKAEVQDVYPTAAHLAPLWGAITFVLGLSIQSSAYMFLFSHARTLASAAVRASVFGPYQAQAILADTNLQSAIKDLVQEYWNLKIEDAGQTVPAMDIWIGRHELLYSRIFNS